ncbi:hypothetical protein CWO04_10025 [Vibrio splendidus]|uniref:acyltransferase family protein n=1 Tax=Vibrio splendidus TaxID=29497 RepID=UPI000D356286|nr:hypothetical protein CWO04_10025 [Vibrio splendidus]
MSSLLKSNNLDHFRLFLAIVVVWFHYVHLIGAAYSSPLHFINSTQAVYCFFILSGGLIWISFENSRSINEYFKKRFLRLYPAYAFTIFIFGLIFYLSFDGDSLVNYLFYNAIFLNFMSPCVINDVTSDCTVNGSLWTIKIEVMYYIFVPFLIYGFKSSAKRWVYTFGIFSFLFDVYFNYNPNDYYSLLKNQIVFKFYYFSIGVFIFSNVNVLNDFKKYIAPFVVLIILIFNFGFSHYMIQPFYLASLLVLLCFYIKCLPSLKPVGDLSYSMYLYHYPIIIIFRELGLISASYSTLSFLSVIVFLMIISTLSWKYIELPFLKIARERR